eukprot:630750-Pelagomonas_calceolata.AAC.4
MLCAPCPCDNKEPQPTNVMKEKTRKEKLRRQRKLSLYQLRTRRHIGSEEPLKLDFEQLPFGSSPNSLKYNVYMPMNGLFRAWLCTGKTSCKQTVEQLTPEAIQQSKHKGWQYKLCRGVHTRTKLLQSHF